jgi:hypothetical protein
MTPHNWVQSPTHFSENNYQVNFYCEECGSKAYQVYNYEQLIIRNSKNWYTDCDLAIIKQIDEL